MRWPFRGAAHIETLRIAASSLGARRGRSALTVLSITIGAFAIVVMSSLAESGLLTMVRGFEELGGARVVMVVQKTPERGEAKQAAYARGLTLVDRDSILRELPHVRGVTLFSRLRKMDIQAPSGLRVSSDVVAADARFFDVFRMRVAHGRAFTDDENRGRARLCVVGHKLAEKIGLDGKSARDLGVALTVGSMRCRIAGVLADNERFGVGFGFSWTDLVIVPSESLADLDARVRERAAIFMQTDDSSSNDAVKRFVNARLVARHPGVDDFSLFDFEGFMKRFQAVFAAIQMIVALLAGIALLIGGVGVMNMMLVSVSERVREIGIRKSLGARPSTIGAQFLAEAVLLSVVGGSVGVLAGLAIAFGAGRLIVTFLPTWHLSLAPDAAVTALIVSVGVGVLFGWLPAQNAAKLDPILAMRR